MAGSYLKQSTASQSRCTPPFLSDTDFKTAQTGLTIANTDVKLIINGAVSADKNSGGGTHRANGCYSLTFDATDTATVGEMLVSIKVAGALPVFMKFWVLEEAVYDALFGASALGYVANAPVNVAQFGGSNGTFSGGRPEVNTSHVAGSAISQTAGVLNVNATQFSGSTTAADNAEIVFATDFAANYNTTADKWNASVTHYNGTAGTFASGRPEVNMSHIAGAAVSTTTAQIGVNLINISGAAVNSGVAQLGVNIVSAGGTNWGSGAITAGSIAADAFTAAKFAADVTTEFQSGLATQASVNTIDDFLDTEITSIIASLQGLVLERGTIGATGNDTTHVHLPAFTYGDDEINSYLLVVHDVSEDEYHVRPITDWVNSTKLATVATLPFTPQASTDGFFLLYAQSGASGGLDAAGVRAAVGLASANLDTQLSGIQTDTNAIEVDTQDIQSRLPAALVSGRMSSDAVAISGSTTAADNVEVVYSTDFATNYSTARDKWQVEADVTALSGDSAAADALESYADGTTPMPVNMTHKAGDAIRSLRKERA